MEGVLGVMSGEPNSDLRKMFSKLSHRGKLQNHLSQKKALGQVSSQNTKSVEEVDGIYAVSDCRIDNKPELIELLGIKDLKIPDNLLFIHAYKKWGTKFANYLVGAFAIAICDLKTEKVTLIRDYTGVRSLYYFFNQSGQLAFSSEPKSILALDFVPKCLNQDKVDTYLEWPSDIRAYSGQTFYKHIQNVLPATSLTFNLATSSQPCVNFYWEIDPKKYANLKSDSDFATAFKATFTKAVKRRLKTDGSIAAHLSGGLDSSAISVTANKLLKNCKKTLNTVHYDTKNLYCDETDYAKEVLKTDAYNHCWVQRSNTFEKDLIQFNHKIQQPDPHTLSLAIFKKNEHDFYKANRVKVVLTGHDGDTTLDKGISEFILFLKQSKIKEYKQILTKAINNKDLTSIYREWHEWSLEKKLKKYTELFFLSSIQHVYQKKGSLKTFKHILDLIRENLVNTKSLLKLTEKGIKKLISRAKKVREKPKEFVSYSPKNLSNTQLSHFNRITCAAIVESNEIYDLLGSYEGFHYCHPFQDKDLMELCLFTPFSLKFFNGMGRGPLRLAMKGLLPEKVRNRVSKVNFVPLIQENLLLIKPPIPESIAEGSCAEKLDLPHLSKLYQKLKTKTLFYSNDINQIQRAHFFSEWKKNFDNDYPFYE